MMLSSTNDNVDIAKWQIDDLDHIILNIERYGNLI